MKLIFLFFSILNFGTIDFHLDNTLKSDIETCRTDDIEIPFSPKREYRVSMGTDYNVGPGQPLATISEVPWATLQAGDRVFIHWKDTP